MSDQRSVFELLRYEYILKILVGDVEFGAIEVNDSSKNIVIAMPFLSGSFLCNIAFRFGLFLPYNGDAQDSWVYLNHLLAHCIETHHESDLLSLLFSKEQFVEKLKGNTFEVIENAYKKIVETIIDKINGYLLFGGSKLVWLGDRFIIIDIDTHAKVSTHSYKNIDNDYIVKLSKRAMLDVLNGDFDSAITKSRTLLEEVFCYVIEKKGETPSDSGDIGKLYNQVKHLYNMHQDKDIDKRINGLLSGLEKILTAIAEMRNKGSDSHGIGAKRIKISEHHARLFVNSAMTMADFVLAVGNRSEE